MDSHQLDIALIDILRANLPDYLYNGNPSMSMGVINGPHSALVLALLVSAVSFVLLYGTKRPSGPFFTIFVCLTAVSLFVYFFIGTPKYHWRTDRTSEEISVEYLRRVNSDMANYGEATAGIGSRAATDRLSDLITCSEDFHQREVCKKGQYARNWAELDERLMLLEIFVLTQEKQQAELDRAKQYKQRIDGALGRQKGEGV